MYINKTQHTITKITANVQSVLERWQYGLCLQFLPVIGGKSFLGKRFLC